MAIKKWIILMMCAAVLCLPLISCTPSESKGNQTPGGQGQTEDGTDQKEPNQPEDQSQNGLGQQPEKPTLPDTYPTDEQIEDAYQKATEAFGWFNIESLPTTGDPVEIDGYYYKKVDDDRFKTAEDLKTYLSTLFDDALVEVLLFEEDFPMYRDYEGELYGVEAARGTDIRMGKETHEITKTSDTAYDFAITVERLGEDLETVEDYKTYHFTYEYTDGKWVFTHFRIIR